ncbi:hypothetical protein [Nonomuraea sp. NPDC050643]|uniref:hypothetical protein n=1 Tax=Nonomuraea sp. NPDC050643 TaxID=3155660 RepID=UPI0033FA081D
MFLVLVIPDSRLMMGVAYTPLLLVAPPFGWGLGGATFADAWPWPVLNQLLCVVGGLLLAATALAYGRDRARWFTPERGRRAVYVAVGVPLVYCLTRWAWALGVPLGVNREFLAAGEDGLWLAGAYLATFGALGGVLTLGPIQRWGEVFPRWIPGLRGRRVPPLLAVVPAGFVSIIVTVAGLTYLRWTLAGRFALAEWGPGCRSASGRSGAPRWPSPPSRTTCAAGAKRRPDRRSGGGATPERVPGRRRGPRSRRSRRRRPWRR